MEGLHVYTVTSSMREHRWIRTQRGLREQTQAILAGGNTASAEMYSGSDRASRDERGIAGWGRRGARQSQKKEMQYGMKRVLLHKIQESLFGITKTEHNAIQK